MGFLEIAKKAVKCLQYVPGCTLERNRKNVIKYNVAHYIFGLMCQWKGYEIEVNGAENLENGPGWIWSRHTSDKDIPDISSILYSATGKMPHLVGRKTLASTPFEREQYLEWGTLFLDRQGRGNISQAMQIKGVMDKVADGNYVIIFPEGTRNPDFIGDFNKGAAWMAHRLASRQHDAPIYCMGVYRKDSFLNPRNGVVINIAPPFYVSDFGGAPKRECIETMKTCSKRLVAMLSSSSGPDIASMSSREALEMIVKGTQLASAGVSSLSGERYASGCSLD